MNYKQEKIVFQKTEYFAKSATGTLRYWSITGFITRTESERRMGRIEMSHGQWNGEMQGIFENVEFGLAGRSLEEQVLSRVNSRIQSKMKAGYVTSMNDAMMSDRKNILGLERCMTACVYKDHYKKIDWKKDNHVQRKYNGLRCNIHRGMDRHIPYSRNGLEFKNLEHIIEDLYDLEEGMTTDGELYIHGVPLQTINSLVKRKQDRTNEIKYMIYDVFMDAPFSDRYDYIKKMKFGPSITVAQTFPVYNHEDAMEYCNQFIEDGYEGAMFRSDVGQKYENGKRSKSLLKMKKPDDGEFLITDVIPSSEGLGIAVCITKTGKRFDCFAPGTKENKKGWLDNKQEYIGQYLHIEHYGWTLEGKPFQPIGKYVRNKDQE